MRRILVGVVFYCIITGAMPFVNQKAEAAECRLGVQISRQEDGGISGELWYNSQLLWRVAVMADGARPVTGKQDTRTIWITPQLDQGMFFLRVD